MNFGDFGHIGYGHRSISVNFLEQIECFSWSFSNSNEKLQVDSLFNAHYLLTKEEKKRKKYLLNKLSQNELQ